MVRGELGGRGRRSLGDDKRQARRHPKPAGSARLERERELQFHQPGAPPAAAGRWPRAPCRPPRRPGSRGRTCRTTPAAPTAVGGGRWECVPAGAPRRRRRSPPPRCSPWTARPPGAVAARARPPGASQPAPAPGAPAAPSPPRRGRCHPGGRHSPRDESTSPTRGTGPAPGGRGGRARAGPRRRRRGVAAAFSTGTTAS